MPYFTIEEELGNKLRVYAEPSTKETDFLQQAHNEIVAINKKCNDAVKGKHVKIIDAAFNGQPHGNSKPSLKGQIFEVSSVTFDHWNVHIFLKGFRGTAAFLTQVEFVDD